MKNQYKDIPLLDLFLKLKKAGFSVPVDVIYEFQKIIVASETSGPLSQDKIAEICSLLIAKNKFQQNEIRHLVTQYFTELSSKPSNNPKKKYSALLYIFAGAFIFYFTYSLYQINNKYKEAEIVKQKSIKNSFVSDVLSKTNNQDMYVKMSDDTLAADAIQTYDYEYYSIDTAEQRIQQFLKNYKIPYTGPVFGYLKESYSPIVVNYPNYWYILLYTVFGIFVYIQFRKYSSLRYNKNEGLSNSKDAERNRIDPPFELEFEYNRSLINREKLALGINSLLARNVSHTLTRKLDVKKTASKTALNAGYIRPVYESEKSLFQYTFLIQKSIANNHCFQLSEWFVDLIIECNHDINKYYYTSDLERLVDEFGEEVHLITASEKIANNSIFIVAKAESLFQANTGELKSDFISLLKSWDNLIVIVHKPVIDWSFFELSLLKAGAIVLPADSEAIRHYFNNNGKITSPTEFKQALKRQYSILDYDFDSVYELEDYLLDDNLFQWLCALAVYPVLKWELTLEIGKLIDSDYNDSNKSILEYDKILKLVRIKWFDNGCFEDNIRYELLKKLSPELHLKVRLLIKKLLLVAERNIPSTSFAIIQLEQQRTINNFLIYAKKGFFSLTATPFKQKVQDVISSFKSFLRVVGLLGKNNNKKIDIVYEEGFNKIEFDADYRKLRDNWETYVDWAIRRHIDSGINNLMPNSRLKKNKQMVFDEYTDSFENRTLRIKKFVIRRPFYIKLAIITIIVLFLSFPKLSKNVFFIPLKGVNVELVQASDHNVRVKAFSSEYDISSIFRGFKTYKTDSSFVISNLKSTHCKISTELYGNYKDYIVKNKINYLYCVGESPTFVMDNKHLYLSKLYGNIIFSSDKDQFVYDLYIALIMKSADFFYKNFSNNVYIVNKDKIRVDKSYAKDILINEVIPKINIGDLSAWIQASKQKNTFLTIFKSDNNYFIIIVEKRDADFLITDLIY